jgi:hypothetical protein
MNPLIAGASFANLSATPKAWRGCVMTQPKQTQPSSVLDEDRIDDAVLALLSLGRHGHGQAWKGFDWDAMDRLYEKGMIDNPRGKAKSVLLTEEGLRRSEALFETMFTKQV